MWNRWGTARGKGGVYLCVWGMAIFLTVKAKLPESDSVPSKLDVFVGHKDIQLKVNNFKHTLRVNKDFSMNSIPIFEFCSLATGEEHSGACMPSVQRYVDEALQSLYIDHVNHLKRHLINKKTVDSDLNALRDILPANHVKLKYDLVTNNDFTTVCESEFGFGETSLLWLLANPRIKVVAFGKSSETQSSSSAYLQTHFPGRLEIISMDHSDIFRSIETIKSSLECDLLILKQDRLAENNALGKERICQSDKMFWAISILNKKNKNSRIIFDRIQHWSAHFLWDCALQIGLLREVGMYRITEGNQADVLGVASFPFDPSEQSEIEVLKSFVRDHQKLYGLTLLMYLNDAYLELTKNWICNLQKLDDQGISILQKTVFITSTDTANAGLKRFSSSLNVFTITYPVTYSVSYGTYEYYRLTVERLNLQNILIQEGSNIMIVEADAQWNSVSIVDTIFAELKEYDIVSANDMQEVDKLDQINAGFLAIRSTMITRTFFQIYVDEYTHTLNQHYDTDGFIGQVGEQHYMTPLLQKYKLKVKWLTPCEVANGQWYIYGARKDCPLPTVILNNYIIGNAEKKARALNFQHWHLRDNMMACQGDEWEPPRLKARKMYFAPFASTGLTPKKMWSALYGNQRLALTFKRLEVVLPRVQRERPVDLCYVYPATSKHNRRCSAWDGHSMVHLLNFHVYIGVTSLAIWLQDHKESVFSQTSVKRLSGVHHHHFCVLPEDLPRHLCDGTVHGSDNESVGLSALPFIRLDQELNDSTLHQDETIRLHRFPEYSTVRIGLPSVVEPLESIVVNNSTLESHVLRAIWKEAEYSVNYRGVMVEIPNGYVVGNFVYDKVRRYGLDGCCTEFSQFTPQAIGDTVLQALPRRSRHGKLVLIRSWLSTTYYHMLIEAGPRILYVLQLVQSDPRIQLLVDPVRYGERRPHDELFAGLLGLPRSQIVDFDEWTVYSADTLYVPPGTPCENPPPILLRKWSLTLRSALLRSVSGTDTLGTCVHRPRQVVVIVRRNEKAAKGNVLTSTELDAMRAGDAEISTRLLQTLEKDLPDDVAVIAFYGNISMQKTAALFQNADAVVGASGAGFANLVFSRPSTTVITYISRAFFEFNYLDHAMRAFPEGSHTGMALKLGMRPRLIIVEDLERAFPFEEVCSAVRRGLEQPANHRREACAASS